MSKEEASEYLKNELRSKTGEVNKVVAQICQAKHMDYTILDAKYEQKMEKLIQKYPDSIKMAAQYQVYVRKRHAIV